MTTNPSAAIFHSTYFKLKDGSSPDARESYLSACREYLSTSRGMTSFWVGERTGGPQRPVNDQAFDVAMHQVFLSKDAFAQYNGQDPKHDQFVAEVDRWAVGTTRRVLDTYLSHLSIGGTDSSGLQVVAPDGSLPSRLTHSVYFSLTDKSDKSRAGFKDICLKFLSGQDGQCVFAIGDCANPLGRPVNVENFDVAVYTAWVSADAYQRYLSSQRHKDFFPATQGMLANTYVFDNTLRYEKNDRVYARS
jgi:hypothetical protein